MAKKTEKNINPQENTKNYQIIGNSYTDKEKAQNVLRSIHKKGFKRTGLIVKNEQFVIFYGAFASAAEAERNLKAIQASGLDAQIKEAGLPIPCSDN